MLRMLVLGLTLSSFACAPPCEKPAPPPPPDPPDAGPPPTLLRCQPVGLSPRTAPAGAAVDVTLGLFCEGADEGREVTVAIRARWADRTTSDFTRTVTLKAGDTDVSVRLPAGQLAVGPRAAVFDVSLQSSATAPIELATPEAELSIAGHLAADAVATQWAGVEAFDPAPPSMAARRVAVLVRDVTGDDMLDALVVWRDGSTLTFETFTGPALSRLGTRSVTDPRLAVGTANETVRFARRRGATSDRSGALHWYAVDATPQEARVVVVDVTDGMPGMPRVYDSMGLPRVERVIGSDAIFDATVMDNGAPERLLTFIGNDAGRRSFVTVVTQAISGKLMVLSNVPAFDGVTPADVLGGMVQAGLTRSWKVTAPPTIAVDPGNVLAWVHVPPLNQRQATVRRAPISGPGAGTLTGGVAAYATSTGEALVHLTTADADGDRTPDLVLVTRDDAVPAAVRTFSADLQGAITTTRRVDLPVTTFDAANVSVWTSAQAPHAKATCGGDDRWCGSTDHFLVVSGGSVVGVPVLAAVGRTAAGVWPLSVPTRNQLERGSSSGAARIGVLPSEARPQKRLVFGRVLPDDEVVLATHPNGVSIRLSAARGGLDLGGIEAPTDFTSLRFTQAPWLVEDAATRETFIIVPNEPGAADARWSVWLLTAAGLVGPSTWTLPTALGRFRPLAHSSGALDFARQDGAKLEQLSLTMAQARQLVVGGTARTFTMGDVKMLGGVDRSPLGRDGARVAQLKIREEAALKRRQQESTKWKAIGVGQDATVGATETIAVLGVDESDPCPYRTVLYPGDPSTTTPVTLSESTSDGCADLDVPVVTGDVCGIGGQQVVTAQRQPGSSDDSIWNFHVWLRAGTGIVRAEIGRVELPMAERPTVSLGDVNGDGTADLVVSSENRPAAVFFNDGLGQSFGGASVRGFSDAVRSIPGAGPGLGGGQTACGAGLQCGFGIGTRTTTSQANNKAELL